jgi:hypothetical protein
MRASPKHRGEFTCPALGDALQVWSWDFSRPRQESHQTHKGLIFSHPGGLLRQLLNTAQKCPGSSNWPVIVSGCVFRTFFLEPKCTQNETGSGVSHCHGMHVQLTGQFVHDAVRRGSRLELVSFDESPMTVLRVAPLLFRRASYCLCSGAWLASMCRVGSVQTRWSDICDEGLQFAPRDRPLLSLVAPSGIPRRPAQAALSADFHGGFAGNATSQGGELRAAVRRRLPLRLLRPTHVPKRWNAGLQGFATLERMRTTRIVRRRARDVDPAETPFDGRFQFTATAPWSRRVRAMHTVRCTGLLPSCTALQCWPTCLDHN